jgi:hypothetical protein
MDRGITRWQLKPGRSAVEGEMVTVNMLRRRVTRFREWKGRHGDRIAKGCYRAIQREIAETIARMKNTPVPIRPIWFKPWVENLLGYKVRDAWYMGGQIHVQAFGKFETVEVTVTFER